MSYASWPYDNSLADPLSTLRGRLGRVGDKDLAANAPDRPADGGQTQESDDSRLNMASVIRTTRITG
jgi:hypothetical protein